MYYLSLLYFIMTKLPEFTGLQPYRPIQCYRRNLPHWRQDGATYFVTFRLSDSIPKHKIEEWQIQRNNWYVRHGLTHDLTTAEWATIYKEIPLKERGDFESWTAQQRMVELDLCHGSCLLNKPETTQSVQKSLQFFDGERYRCGDFAIMPNHIHWIVMPLPGHQLEQIMQDIKSFTGHQINKLHNRRGKVWQQESYDRLIRNSKELYRTRRYIYKNPPKAGLSSDNRTWQCKWLDSVYTIKFD
ncbi:MAG: transposase [Lentisphaeria bacterium]